MSESKTIWQTLNDIDISKYVKQKGKLDYLPWSSAIGLVKPYYPGMSTTIYKNDLGFNYHTDGHTCWVEVGVTIEEQEEREYLPVMNHANKSIPKDQVTSVDVNKAIKRGIVKALSNHGLGIELYAGEELPSETEEETRRKSYSTWSKANEQERLSTKKEFMIVCEDNGVNRDDVVSFLDFVSPGMKENEKFNEIVHFMRKSDLLVDQLEAYLKWKAKQAS